MSRRWLVVVFLALPFLLGPSACETKCVQCLKDPTGAGCTELIASGACKPQPSPTPPVTTTTTTTTTTTLPPEPLPTPTPPPSPSQGCKAPQGNWTGPGATTAAIGPMVNRAMSSLLGCQTGTDCPMARGPERPGRNGGWPGLWTSCAAWGFARASTRTASPTRSPSRLAAKGPTRATTSPTMAGARSYGPRTPRVRHGLPPQAAPARRRPQFRPPPFPGRYRLQYRARGPARLLRISGSMI